MDWRLVVVALLFFAVLAAVAYVLVNETERYEVEQRAAQSEEGRR